MLIGAAFRKARKQKFKDKTLEMGRGKIPWLAFFVLPLPLDFAVALGLGLDFSEFSLEDFADNSAFLILHEALVFLAGGPDSSSSS